MKAYRVACVKGPVSITILDVIIDQSLLQGGNDAISYTLTVRMEISEYIVAVIDTRY